ncbi:DNA translocase FtsK [Hydrogenoanaerobacterium sp.]|uniref:FtsK/SpoIIIE family DNA translocase n=1 Tax=Hydrogenoanaerobacterium sp. TaxID=2953763 RepID=UPI002898ED8A|nr:DNA translocase FtsK [Hydrogenoanaerobacterium sp.]
MAERKSGGTATKRKNSERAKRAAETKARQEAQARYQKQLCALGLFAAGIFLFAVCIVEGQNFWTTLHNSLFGLFGWCAFLLPASLIYIAVLATMDKGNIKHKLWQTGVLILLLCGITHAFAMGDFESAGLWDSIVYLFESGIELRGGGLFAGVIGVPFTALFGATGAKVTMIILIFVFLMIITGTTLHEFMKSAYKPVKKIEEAYIERAEERRTVSGARFNIDVPLAEEELPQHPVQSPKATMEYTDSMKMERDKLLGKDGESFTGDPPKAKGLFGFGKKQPAAAPADKADKLGIDDIVNKAMGLEANAFKPVYISDADAESGMISEPTAQPKSDDGRFCFQVGVEEKIENEFGSDSSDETMQYRGAVTEIPVEQVNSLPLEPMDAHTMLQRALAEELQPEEDTHIDGRFQAKFTEVEGKEDFNAYIFPPINLLKETKNDLSEDVPDELKANAQRLVDTLNSFGVQTRIIDICRGPAVTRYELQPSAGVKISKITGLADDIALNLAAAGVRIEAPIPNKAAVGIEVPNKTISMVGIRELIDSDVFMDAQSKLTVALGKDISGNITTADIGKMPHVLIAGATGSGKSVCINSIIISLLYKSTPDEIRLLMIDPKVVELGVYNGIPHLLVPVVTDPRKAAGALNWAVSEMLNRYKIFADNSVRDLKGYNKLAKQEDSPLQPMPEIVIIIDELADLMMAAPNEVEDAICRLAQMARAAGMHLVIATQRPSVDVITGVIKANIPSRIAFAVSSQIDSRTILDGGGAEKLLGRGDMLFLPVGVSKPTRVQGCYVSDKEVEKVVKFVKDSQNTEYDEEIMNEIERQAVTEKGKGSGSDGGGFDAEDEMLAKAIEVVVEIGQASTSLLQRKLKLGYARAARIIDDMEERGIVGPFEGSKPRAVLITRQQWVEMRMNSEEQTV